MHAIEPDQLVSSLQELQATLETPYRGGEELWADTVFNALGQVAAAIQEEIQATRKSKKSIGEINPDFRNAPTAERHVETAREDMIRLGETVHQLRAEIRQAIENQNLNVSQLRRRGQEIAAAIEKLRNANDKFLLHILNSNPGSGE